VGGRKGGKGQGEKKSFSRSLTKEEREGKRKENALLPEEKN